MTEVEEKLRLMIKNRLEECSCPACKAWAVAVEEIIRVHISPNVAIEPKAKESYFDGEDGF